MPRIDVTSRSKVASRLGVAALMLLPWTAVLGQSRLEFPAPLNEIAPAGVLPHQIEAMPTVEAEMSVIRRRSQLIVARTGIVRTHIADPTVIDVVQFSENELSVIGMALGSTTLTLWFENDPRPLIYKVRCIRDPHQEEQARIDYGKLEQKIAELFPESKVYLIPISGKILVQGWAKDNEEAHIILELIRGEVINQLGNLGGPQPGARGAPGSADFDIVEGVVGGNRNGLNVNDRAAGYVINMLRVPGEFQVMLRVRIAELNRSMLRRLGVNWTTLINDGRHVITSAVGGTPSSITGIFEEGEISILINALHSNGYAKILTEPTLTVLSGHDATFLSGGEFAVPNIVSVGNVAGQQTVFRGFGTSMIVTPTIVDRDLIRLRIRPEFSETTAANSTGGGGGAGAIPGLSSRRVETTVELREGQTIVLGGLLSHRSGTEVTRVPWLGGIPVIGPLVFSAKRSTEDETELIILVTPEIVRPLEADEVPPVPGFEVNTPEDYLLYMKAFSENVPQDTGVYQLAPYGHNSGVGIPIGHGQFNPAPANPLYSPVPTGGPQAPAAPWGLGRGGSPQFGRSSAPATGSYTPYSGPGFSNPGGALPGPTAYGPGAGSAPGTVPGRRTQGTGTLRSRLRPVSSWMPLSPPSR